jgi:hypothetical protein
MTKAVTSVRKLEETPDAVANLSKNRADGKIMIKVS